VTTLTEVAKRGVKDQRDASTVDMASFLWAFEGLYMCRLDAVCSLLIKSGHDLFDPIRRKFASSLEDIQNVDTSTKFKFLEEHEFDFLIKKQEQKLRNKIAHLDFELDDKGRILINGQVVDVRSKEHELMKRVSSITRAMTSAAHAQTKKRAQKRA